MAVIRHGLVVEKAWYQHITDVFWGVVNSIAFFFQTLLAPEATVAYKQHAQKKGWGAGVGGSGRPGGGPGRPRFGGMDSIKNNDHNAACGGGG